MKDFGFEQSGANHTLFVKNQDGKVTILIVYADDMVVTGDDYDEMKLLQEHLATKFEMKDLGCDL